MPKSRREVAFVVAYKTDEPSRIANWTWVKAFLKAHFPDWYVYAVPEADGQLKNRALARGMAWADDADIVILYDADCFVLPRVLRRLVALADTNGWSVPRTMVRLNRSATRRVLASTPTAMPQVGFSDFALIHPWQENVFSERLIPLPEWIGVLKPSVLKSIGGFDETRGQLAEFWTGIAVDTLVGPPAVVEGDVYHLRHAGNSTELNRPSLRRLVQYQLAHGDTAAMRELVRGGDLHETTLLRLMNHWSIPLETGRSELVRDWLDVACMSIPDARPKPPPPADFQTPITNEART